MKKKEEEQELSFGQRFDAVTKPQKEVTMKDFESPKPAPKTGRERFNDKFIKREGGGLARRGTVGARRAENREKNRNRAKAMAKARIAAKKK
jgi:hypothetical protein